MDEYVSFDHEIELELRQDGPEVWTAILTDQTTHRQIEVTSADGLSDALEQLMHPAHLRSDPDRPMIDDGVLHRSSGLHWSSARPPFTVAHYLPREPTLSLSVAGFTLLNDVLHAVANFVGTVTDATGSPTLASFEGIVLPARIRKTTARVLRFEIELPRIELLGIRSAPTRVTLEVSDRDGVGHLRSDLLWSIAQAHEDPTTSPQKIVRLLNQLFSSVA